MKLWGLTGILYLIWTTSAFGQFARGTMTGTVKDSTGAVIPNAAIVVRNEQTGITVKTLSGPDGVYLVLQLQPDTYSVSAEAPGFKHLTIAGLKVDVNTTLTQDMLLDIGNISDSVQVTGETSLVQTTSSQVGSVVSINQVQEIPLQDRNVFNLVNLVAGAYGLNYGEGPNNAWFINISLGGGRGVQTMPFVDGVNATQSGANMQNIDLSPPVDAMQQFRVEINNLSAEFGRTTGGVINAVTKSGTNRFHGSVYEFLRNNLFDANGWGNDSKPPLKRNIFGGTIGGPIRKNRTFFFYNYDGLRNRQSSAVTRNVGLPEWRSGNFSTATRQVGNAAAQLVIYDPATGTGTFGAPRGTLQFPGNIIPSSRLDPVAVKALAFLPNPNRKPDNPFTQAGNWQLNSTPRYVRDYHTVRLDHDFNGSTKMFVRYIQTGPEGSTTPALAGWGAGDPQGGSQPFQRQNGAINVTHLFSPTFFLSYTMGLHHFFQQNKNGPCCDTDWGAYFGIPNAHGVGIPLFNASGGLLPFTNIGQNPQVFITETNWNYILNLTKTYNKHTLKFGIQYDRLGGNRGSNQATGQWIFDGHLTQGVDPNGIAIANTGSALSDFLLGRVNSVAANITNPVGIRLQGYGGYVQDDWRVTRNLTLNIGVRYDTQTPAYEVADRYTNYDPYAPNPLAGTGDIPAGATGILRFQNRNGDGKYLYDWNAKDFAPRFGFAYRVGSANDFVIRGGYGIFYARDSGGALNALTLLLPFGASFTAANPVSFSLKDGFPANYLASSPASALTATWGTRNTQYQQTSFDFMPQQHNTPYNHNFNLNIQKQLHGMLIETGYLGNLARHAQAPSPNINLIPPSLLSNTVIPARLKRPFTALGSDQPSVSLFYATYGISNYHAFILKVERRMRAGFSWTVSYTLSKMIDNVNSTSTTGATWGDNLAPQNYFNRRSERALSTNDVPQRIVISPVAELPFGKGRHFLSQGNKLVNAIVGGWQFSTFATLQRGSPFGSQVVNGGRTLLGDPSVGQLRPNVSGDINSSSQGAPAVGVRGIQWLNPAAFSSPALYTYGNVSRTLPNVLRPPLINFDTMLAKSFIIHERFRTQFRWETFNTTNTPYWGLPATSIGSGNLGVITTATGRRIMQLGAKVSW